MRDNAPPNQPAANRGVAWFGLGSAPSIAGDA